jgi:hypothetical protein
MKKFYILFIAILLCSSAAQAQLENTSTNGGLVYFTLGASAGGNSYSTDFYFNPNASAGFDLGFDAELFGTPPVFSIYSLLVEDDEGEAIALQALNTTNLDNTTIPLGVNALPNEELTISISISTLPGTIEIFLDDTVANTTTLLTNSDYVFTPTAQLFGTGRFFIRTNDTSLSTIENTIDNISIFALNNSKELIVNGQVDVNSTLNLFDIQGRLVLNTKLDSSLSQNRIDVSSLNGGVYIVNVENNGQQKTQKIIIK